MAGVAAVDGIADASTMNFSSLSYRAKRADDRPTRIVEVVTVGRGRLGIGQMTALLASLSLWLILNLADPQSTSVTDGVGSTVTAEDRITCVRWVVRFRRVLDEFLRPYLPISSDRS